ncbi:MAG: hypothetical protein H0X29_00310 [Parachlamydiaceae bacterium]|nr:hypothetical protein [Parachlamydiaceae bacterium]
MTIIKSLKNIFCPVNTYPTTAERRDVKDKRINNIMLNILFIATVGLAFKLYSTYPAYLFNKFNADDHALNVINSLNIINSNEPYSIERATDIYLANRAYHVAPYTPSQTFASIEAGVKHEFGDSALEFDTNDPRPKLLYLVSDNDPSGALKLFDTVDFSAYKIEKGIYPLIKTLNKSHDLRFKVIKKANQICEEIAIAANNNIKISSLIVAAHGNPSRIIFSKPSVDLTLNALRQISLNKNCFSGLDPKAEIILQPCQTGKEKNGIASAIAIKSKKIVWAPKSSITSDSCDYSSNSPIRPIFIDITNFSLFHKILFDLNKNFTAFSRFDSTCKFYSNGSNTCSL